jgi:ubiquinone/menaquinone biosynthesis C-methylase UbiE
MTFALVSGRIITIAEYLQVIEVMPDSNRDDLKAEVREFWDRLSCDTQVASSARFSHDYFEEIESFRYADQPFIHAFAQFTRYRRKRVLEVGFGAGTDFIQWLRAGAIASGIDLTAEALENLTRRIQAYQLPAPERILVADAEQLPFESDSFDLGYSFGVLHHSPDTEKALGELVRVVRPGGDVKIMLYNRHSVYVFNRWVKFGLLRGKPWRSLRAILWHHVESAGTKGYTRRELCQMLTKLSLENVSVHTEITSADYLSASALPPLNFVYRVGLRLAGYSHKWDPVDYIERPDSIKSAVAASPPARPPQKIVFTGNRFGFFHCITATKSGYSERVSDSRLA